MPSPQKLAHVVFQTNDVARLRDWWCNLLEAKVQFGSEDVAFLAFDQEHHRIAMAKFGDHELHQPNTMGMHHVAFTYANLGELIYTYERLRDQDILPWWQIRHGPTLSVYYRDPDGNQAELQVDVYDTVEEANAFMYGPEFAANPIGIEFEMEDVVRLHKEGVPDAELVRRPDDPAR
ncbi:VOC family protein [Streptomyces mirabilis]|uniref:VOC family protein n=1 Tax=Streptomyces mirabilis TaxID=68239 RepID=UPI0036AD87C7